MLNRWQAYYQFLRSFNISILLVLAVVALTLIGLVVLASASLTFVQKTGGVFQKQVISFLLALVAGVFVFMIDLERLRSLWKIMLIGSVVLLVIVLIPGIGVKVNGSQRWLGFGPMRFQVTEVAKFCFIFGLAHYIGAHQREIETFKKGFLIPCCIIGLFCGLILLEPDYGTTFLCAAVGFSMLYLAGSRLMYMLPTLLSGCVLFCIAIFVDPVRMKRITAFLDVEGNKFDSAYQLWQGMLAFAAGGATGVGLGNGRQQLSFLPEAHNDFIFPVIGEELGFFFTCGVVLLYGLIFFLGIRVLRLAPNLFYFSLACGSLLCIIFQALINIGVVTGLLPTKGMSLPFISYGGTNLILVFALMGVLLNCLRTWSKQPLNESREL